MPSTKKETPVEDDLKAFSPGPPAHRMDDKAAALEQENLDQKTRFNRERFLYYFAIVALLFVIVANGMSGWMISSLMVLSLLFLTFLAKHLDAFWAVVSLEKWESLLYDAAKAKLVGKAKKTGSGTEPLELENHEE